MNEIVFNNVTVRYQNKKDTIVALDNISLRLDSGKFHVILGYSGCGKTTLLRSLTGQLNYDGDIFIGGVNLRNIDIKDSNLAFVSQQYVLYPKMTIFDNIAFPLKNLRTPRAKIVERVYGISKALGLTSCLTRKPGQLSGGQQQRVALARALIKLPSICLLDEPLSNVDARTRVMERQFIKRVLTQIGCTVLYVTHDIKEAMALADDITVINNGKIEIVGAPMDVYESDSPVVRSLFLE